MLSKKFARGYMGYFKWVAKYATLAIIMFSLGIAGFGEDNGRWLVVALLTPMAFIGIVGYITCDVILSKLK